MPVFLDFIAITPNKLQTTSCVLSNLITYSLKELFIIDLRRNPLIVILGSVFIAVRSAWKV